MSVQNQMGKLIAYERNRAELTVDELCEGLCSHTFLMRIERGERFCEKILADALLQRAGVSSDKLVYMLNPREEYWLLLREKILNIVEQGDREQALPLLEEYEKLTEKGSKLHRQMLLLMKVVLQWKENVCRPEMLDELVQAWCVTRNGFSLKYIREYQEKGRLTLAELIILMMYHRIEEGLDLRSDAEKGYRDLLFYLREKVDEEDRVKLYPQIAYRLICLLEERGEKDEAFTLALSAVELLQTRGRMFYLRSFLKVLYQSDKYSDAEKSKMQMIMESLEWLYRRYNVPEETWVWDIPFGMAEAEVSSHVISTRRKAMGMSQEEFSEGICDPVTLSRIECGKVTPKKEIFHKLMERAGMTGGNFEMIVQVECPELLELAVRANVLLGFSKGREAEPLLDELEKRMRMDNKFAKQYFLHMKSMTQFNQKKISASEFVKVQTDALLLTFPQERISKGGEWNYSVREVSIINALSYACGNVGTEKEMIGLLQKIVKQYETKSLPLQHYVAAYELTTRNLGNVLGNVGRYEEAIAAAEKGIVLSLKAGRGNIINMSLYDVGWDMEQLWERHRYSMQESFLYVKASYALNLLFGRKRDCDFLSQHMEELYAELL